MPDNLTGDLVMDFAVKQFYGGEDYTKYCFIRKSSMDSQEVEVSRLLWSGRRRCILLNVFVFFNIVLVLIHGHCIYISNLPFHLDFPHRGQGLPQTRKTELVRKSRVCQSRRQQNTSESSELRHQGGDGESSESRHQGGDGESSESRHQGGDGERVRLRE